VAKSDVDAIRVADYLLALGEGGLVVVSFKMTSWARGNVDGGRKADDESRCGTRLCRRK
jgi:hypothetical protein